MQAYEARDQSEHEIELIKRQMKEREELWEAELKQLNQKVHHGLPSMAPTLHGPTLQSA